MLLEKYDTKYYRLVSYNSEKERYLLSTYSDKYFPVPKNFETFIINEVYFKNENGDFEIDYNKALEIHKKYLLELLEDVTKNYIEKYYSEVKQRSDVNDKEFYTSLIVKKQGIDLKTLSEKIYDEVANFFDGIKTLDECIANICPKDDSGNILTYSYNGVDYPYTIPYSQLLKVAIRQTWVQLCKMTYHKLKLDILNLSSFDNVSNILIDETVFPKYPL